MSVNNQEDNNNPFGHLELEPETEDYDGHDTTTHHKKDQSNNTQTTTGVSDPTVSTTTTSRTTIDVSSHYANPTQQQQPQQQKQKQQERHEQQEEDDIYYQLMDVSDKATAWAIHICLIVFAVIVIVAVVLAFLAIESYGVVAIVAISMIVLALGGLGWFVHSIVQDDHRLRPIRREIHSWTKVIQQIVQDEMDAFYDEWQDEYKLLTYGDVSSTKDGTQQQQQQHPTNQKSLDEPSSLDCDPSNSISMPSPRRKRKSVLFTMVRPFLTVKRRVFSRSKRNNSNSNNSNSNNDILIDSTQPTKETCSMEQELSPMDQNSSYQPPPHHSPNIVLSGSRTVSV